MANGKGPVKLGEFGMVSREPRSVLKFGELPEGESDETVKDKARTAAVLTAAIEPDRTADLDTLWRDSVEFVRNSPNTDKTINNLKRQLVAKRQRDVLSTAIKGEGFTSEDEVTVNPQDFQDLAEAYEGQSGTTRAEVDSIQSFNPNAITLDTVEQEMAEVDLHGANLIKKLSQDEDQWSEVTDKIADYGGFLFVPDFTKDLMDIGMSPNDFARLATAFQQLPAEDQMDFLSERVPQWWEEFERNEIKTAMMVDMLSNPNAASAKNVEVMFDAMGALDIGGPVVGGVAKLLKAGNLGKKAMRVGAKDVATEVSKRAEARDEVGESISGQKGVDAVDNRSPFVGGSGVNANKVDGVADTMADLDPHLQEEIEALRSNVQAAGERASRYAEDFLTPEEAQTARKQAVNKLREASEKAGAKLTDVIVEKGDRLGFTIRARWNGNKIESRHNYTTNDAGQLQIDSVDSALKQNLWNHITSAQTKLSGFRHQFVDDLVFADQQSKRVFDELQRVSRSIDKGLSGQQKNDLNAVLLAGDDKITGRNPSGFVYTVDDLKDGVETAKGTVHLDDKAIRAYYKRVAFFEELGQIQNMMARNRLKAQGMKDIRFSVKNNNGGTVNTTMVGRPVDDTVLTEDLSPRDLVYDPSSNTKSKFIQANTAARNTEGRQVIELLEPMHVKRGGKDITVNHMVVPHGGRVSQLPLQVLNIAPGYVPRIRQKGMVYVKDLDSMFRRTVRAFPSMKTAKQWVETQKKKAVEEGLEEPNYQPIRDDEMNNVEKALGNYEQVGGLYTSPRKKDPLITDENGEQLERLNVGEATGAYMSSLSKQMPINEYRMAMIKRWENSAQAAVKRFTGEDKKVRFIDDEIPLPDSDDAGALKRMLENSRDYLQRQFTSQNTNEYRLFRQSMLNIADFVDGRPYLGKKPRNWALNMAHSDPVAALKGAAFNLHLGMFNLRQLYVQSQNASIAVSLHPVHGMKAATEAIGIQMALPFIRSGRNDVVKQIGKFVAPGRVDEFTKRARSFHESGMADTVIHTADYDAQAYGVGTNSWGSVRSLAKAGRIPFEQGELFSRATSWGIAARRFREKTGRWPTEPSDIKEAATEAYRLQINMQRQNAAAWQNNKLLSIPTQFLQAQAKFLENVILGARGKGNWTRAEASRALAGQIVLYGTVGVPMAQSVYGHLADMTGLSPQEIENKWPNIDETVEEGLIGVLGKSVGLDVNMSTAGSLLADLGDNFAFNLLDAAIRMDTSRIATREFFGPSASVVMRGKDAVNNLYWRARTIANVEDWTEIPDELASIASGFAEMASSWSNAQKAKYMYHQKQLLSNRGSVNIGEDKLEEMDKWDAIFRAMGFPTDAEIALWELREWNFQGKDERQKVVNQLSNAAHKANAEGDVRYFTTMRDILLSPYSDAEQKDIMENVFNRAFGDETVRDRELNEMFRNILERGSLEDIPTTAGDLQENEQ